MVTGEQFIGDEKRAEINQKYTAEHMGIENFEQNCETASERSAEIVMGILAR
ncbi:MAG: hypothetical protein K2P73_05360 [Lachnospiraceae bacterium]|jgi:adenosylhomocysteine nucleosidase|nr:hypothetical protein [Lachnospiraceae bacterium]